jgi:hypothetical protein
MGPSTPPLQRLVAITQLRFGLFRFRSPLLTESRLLSLPVGTEMFHFPTLPPLALCVQARVTGHDSSRVSPFGHPRITARLPAPRGLSQASTSFFGSCCLDILRVPLLTWPHKDQMLASTVQFSRYGWDYHRLCVDRSTSGVRCVAALVPPTARGRRLEEESLPQDPTACLGATRLASSTFPPALPAVLVGVKLVTPTGQCSTHERPPRHVRPR